MNASLLTRRIGPLPAWVWGGLAAAGVWFFLLRGKPSGASSSGTSSGATATPGPDATYGLGYAQGQQASAAGRAVFLPAPTPATSSSTTSTSTAASSTNTVFTVIPRPPGYGTDTPGAPGSGAPVYGSKDSATPMLGEAGWGSHVTAMGPPQQGRSVPGRGNLWIPLTNGGWIFAGDVIGGVGGVGGPRTARKHAMGSRAAAPIWSDAHPLVGGPVRYPHYVQAVGGPANHGREVARVARQAGVHPARVAMLNPTWTGRIRIA